MNISTNKHDVYVFDPNEYLIHKDDELFSHNKPIPL